MNAYNSNIYKIVVMSIFLVVNILHIVDKVNLSYPCV